MLKDEYTKCLEDNNQLRDSIDSEELLNHQLVAQVSELKMRLKNNESVLIERDSLKEE